MVRQKQVKIKKKWKDSGIKVSKELRDIIHGYVMSDGYIAPTGKLYIEQSQKQKLFVQWLYLKLQLIRTQLPIAEVKRFHPKTGKQTVSLRFFSLSILQGFHHMWYTIEKDEEGKKRYKKKIPNSFSCFFNPVMISLWFAGDGTKILGSQGAKFEVSCFTISERLLLKQLFLKKYFIKTSIIKSGLSKTNSSQWALKILASDYQTFRRLITTIDLIPNCFPYKLHKKKNDNHY